MLVNARRRDQLGQSVQQLQRRQIQLDAAIQGRVVASKADDRRLRRRGFRLYTNISSLTRPNRSWLMAGLAQYRTNRSRGIASGIPTSTDISF